MENKTKRATIALTPTEDSALDVVVKAYGTTRSEALRLWTLKEIQQKAATITGDAA